MSLVQCIFFFFLITRISTDQFGVQLFQFFFMFCYLCTITNFKFKIFVIMLPTIFSICAPKNIRRFYFCGSMTCFVVFVNYFIYFINVHIFWYCSCMLVDRTLQSYDRSFSNSRISLIVCWLYLSVIVMQPWLHWPIVKLSSLIYSYLIGFTTSLIQDFFEMHQWLK